MTHTNDGKHERALNVDGVEWNVRLMPFGEDAHYHQPGQQLKPPRNGLLFTSPVGRTFRHGEWRPGHFHAMSDDELLGHFQSAAPEE